MSLTLQWIGQGGYLLKSDKAAVCIDPYLSDCVEKASGKARLVEPPIQPEKLAVDVVICTHDHLDHLDVDAIPQMDKKKIRFAGPESCRKHLLALDVPENRLVRLDVGGTMQAGDFYITAVYAKHTEDSIGVVIKHEGITLYFPGDTLYDSKLAQVAQFHPDMMVICINGKLGNMNADEAVTLTNQIGPKVAVPSHYGMFADNTEDPAKYVQGMAKSKTVPFVMEFAKDYEIEEILGKAKA